MPPTELLISAGEASGDMYAARLATALRARADVHLFGMGGPRMREAGVDTVVDCAEVNVLGVFEVLHKLPALLRAKRRLLDATRSRRPAFAILTDFPGFHLRLSRVLRRQGVRNIYFVLPQFWAWRPWRANLVRRRFVRGMCIFPFEVDFYRKAGVTVDWIGHPLVDQVRPTMTRAEFAARHGLDASRPIITILPGSRPGELAQHMPRLLQAAASLRTDSQAGAERQFVLALAPGLTRAQITAYLPGSHLTNGSGHGTPSDVSVSHEGAASTENVASQGAVPVRQGTASAVPKSTPISGVSAPEVPFHIIENATYDALAAADMAIVSSGTATVEAALIGVPMVVVYRVAPASAWVARRLVRTPYFAMVNLIAGKRIVPELFQEDFTPERVAAESERLLNSAEARDEMRRELAIVRERLGPPGAIDRAAAIIAAMLLSEIPR